VKLTCAIAFTIATFGLACGPGASESHNSSQSGATPRAGAEQSQHQEPVTLTGCLQNANQPSANATTGTTGSTQRRTEAGSDQAAAGRGSMGERFTLTAEAAGQTPRDGSPKSYVLDGNVEGLRANVNREVRVTGVLDRGAYSPGESQRVRVDSVEPVADGCRGATR
jgi:hypothetical protein